MNNPIFTCHITCDWTIKRRKKKFQRKCRRCKSIRMETFAIYSFEIRFKAIDFPRNKKFRYKIIKIYEKKKKFDEFHVFFFLSFFSLPTNRPWWAYSTMCTVWLWLKICHWNTCTKIQKNSMLMLIEHTVRWVFRLFETTITWLLWYFQLFFWTGPLRVFEGFHIDIK